MAVNSTPIDSTVHPNVVDYRIQLLLSLNMVLGMTSLLSGSIILLNYFLQANTLSNTSFNPTLLGFVCLFFGFLCIAIYFYIDFIGTQFSSSILIIGVLGIGSYLLITPWLISGILTLLIAVFLSTLLFTRQLSIVVFILVQTLVVGFMTMTWFLSTPEQSGFSTTELADISLGGFLLQTSLAMLVLYLLAVIILNSVSNALKDQADFKERLDIEAQMLRQKVDEHTKALNVTAEINRLISTILDSNRLVGDVVEQIRQAFDFYHVQVYFLQVEENTLKIAGATGEVGTALLIGQHKIALGKGLVGQAALTAQPVVITNVTKSAGWISNSLLPETVAEIAVPIIWESKVLGVLDIQHNKSFANLQNNIDILQMISTQLGTAIANIHVFQQVEEHLKRESILNDMALKLQVAPDIQSSMQLVGKNIAQVLEPVRIKIEIDPALLNLNMEQQR